MKRLQTDALWTEIDGYLETSLVPGDDALDAALKPPRPLGCRRSTSHPTRASCSCCSRARWARSASSKSARSAATARSGSRAGFAAGGKLVTLDSNPKCVEVARANIARAGLTDTVEFRIGKAADTLPGLAAEPPFDLIFIDADKEGTPGYFQWSVKLARQGALIVVDNVVREGAILDSSGEDTSVQGMRRFFELAATDPRVSATAIQTVGAKGHDGLAILLVTEGRT